MVFWKAVTIILATMTLYRINVNAFSYGGRLLKVSRRSLQTDCLLSSDPITLDNLRKDTMFIVDGTGMMYNAYFSKESKFYENCPYEQEMKKRIFAELKLDELSEENLNASVLMALATRFVRLIRRVQPKYIAVAMDVPTPTFRKKLFQDYKAQRSKAPLEMYPLFHLVPQLYQALGCRVFTQAGFEADDVMATIGEWAKARQLNVVHVSEDKDMLQLLSPGVHAMNYQFELTEASDVVKRFGVEPSQMCDLRTLLGDPSDNIPGAVGIGPKIATKLINHYNTLEELYSRLGLINDVHVSEVRQSEEVCLDLLQGKIFEETTNTGNHSVNTSIQVTALRETSTKMTTSITTTISGASGRPEKECIEELTTVLQGVRANKGNVLKSLANLTYPKAMFFRQLMVLRKNIKLEGLQIPKSKSTKLPPLLCDSSYLLEGTSEESSSENMDQLENEVIEESSEKEFDFKTLKYKTRSIQAVLNTAEDVKPVKRSLFSSNVTVDYFAYNGEGKNASVVLSMMSPNLSKPLSALRAAILK